MRVIIFLFIAQASAHYLENRRRCPLDVTIHYLAPHEFDCTKFYQCSNGILVEMSCGEGLYFDFEMQICNWPNDVHCEDIFKESKLKRRKNGTNILASTDIPFLLSTPSIKDDVESIKHEHTVTEDTTDSNVGENLYTAKTGLNSDSDNDEKSDMDENPTTIESIEGLNEDTSDFKEANENISTIAPEDSTKESKNTKIDQLTSDTKDYVTETYDSSEKEDSSEKPSTDENPTDENSHVLDAATVDNIDTAEVNINTISKPTDNSYHAPISNEIDHNKDTIQENLSNIITDAKELIKTLNTVVTSNETAKPTNNEKSVDDIFSFNGTGTPNIENVALYDENLNNKLNTDKWITNTEIEHIIVIKPTAIERTSIVKIATTQLISPKIYSLLYGQIHLDKFNIQPTIGYTQNLYDGTTKYKINMHTNTPELYKLYSNYQLLTPKYLPDIQPTETVIQISTTCAEQLNTEEHIQNQPLTYSTAELIQPSTIEDPSNIYFEYTPILKLPAEEKNVADNEIIHKTLYTTVIIPTTTEYTYTLYKNDELLSYIFGSPV